MSMWHSLHIKDDLTYIRMTWWWLQISSLIPWYAIGCYWGEAQWSEWWHGFDADLMVGVLATYLGWDVPPSNSIWWSWFGLFIWTCVLLLTHEGDPSFLVGWYTTKASVHTSYPTACGSEFFFLAREQLALAQTMGCHGNKDASNPEFWFWCGCKAETRTKMTGFYLVLDCQDGTHIF